MTCLDELPILDIQLNERDFSGKGVFNRIYRVDETKAVRIRSSFFYNEKDASDKITRNAEKATINAFHVTEGLYDAGISVPEPQGLVLVNLKLEGTRFAPGFMMEYVEGTTLNRFVGSNIYRDLESLRDDELKKARELGFKDASDSTSGRNCIVTPDRRIVLVDFDSWRIEKAA